MKTETTLLEENRARLDVEVEPERIAHDFEHALGHLVESAKIPGFRAGKVPPAVVLRQYGREAVFQSTLDEFLGRWMAEALDESRLRPSDRPDVTYDGMPEDGEPFRFSAEFPLWPIGTLPADLTIEAVRDELPDPTAEVEAELERLRVESSPLADVERPAHTGDFVEVDLSSTVGGKSLPEGSTQGFLFELGTGGANEEIERAIRGMSAGDVRTTEVQLEGDFPDPKLRGRAATVEIKLHAVRERNLRPLDDAMAAESSEHATVAELRAAIRATFDERIDDLVTSRYRSNVLGALGRAVEIQLTPYLFAERVDELLGNLARSIERQGVPFATWLQSSGRSLTEIRQALIPDAIDSLRRELALEAFAAREQIEVSDDDLRASLLQELDEDHDHAPDDQHDHGALVQEVMESPAKEAARDELRLRRALDRAVELATPITQEQAEAREKLWTPDSDEQTTQSEKPTLWTPGQPR